MSELEKFINYAIHHQEFSVAEEIINFLELEIESFQKGKKRFKKLLGENKSLVKMSHIKGVLEGKELMLWTPKN
jgi:hypothetical protein